MRATRQLLRLALKGSISSAQTAAYAVAGLVGMLIVGVAVQLYADIVGSRSTEDSFFSGDYLVVSKPVTGINSLTGEPPRFTESELADLKALDGIDDVGTFRSASFDVYATVGMGARSMATALFLESIPDRFFDIRPDGWEWNEGDVEVPVIIAKDYLALYNFGYAPSRGMPQITEEMASVVPMRLTLRSHRGGMPVEVRARIVGFSSRLNTIAVPDNFLQAMNAALEGDDAMPSRLILKVKRAGDPEVERYIESHGLQIAGDRLDSARTNRLLTLALAIVVAVGLLIAVLALIIVLLSVGILIEKNRRPIERLVMLGYTPAQIARVYIARVGRINVAVGLIAIAATLVAQHFWHAPLASIGFDSRCFWPGPVVIVVCAVLATLIAMATIRRRISYRF